MNTLIKGLLATTIAFIGPLALASTSQKNFKFNRLHPAGLAIQLGKNIVGIAYYTNNHNSTIGFNFNPITSSKTNNSTSDTSPLFALVFARFNVPLTLHTALGFGAFYGRDFGNKNTDPYFITCNTGPYVALEYSATPHVYIGASFTPVSYTQSVNGITTTKTTTWRYLSGESAQISYRF